MSEEKKPTLRNPVFMENGSVRAQIFNDTRFPDGDVVQTSYVKTIITKNTEYQVEFTQ